MDLNQLQLVTPGETRDSKHTLDRICFIGWLQTQPHAGYTKEKRAINPFYKTHHMQVLHFNHILKKIPNPSQRDAYADLFFLSSHVKKR